MKYLLLIMAVLLGGCTSGRLWLAGYDESDVRSRCEADKSNHRMMGDYDLHLKKFTYTDYSEERIQQNINRCVAQSRSNALMAGVPVVFTIPLIP